MKIFYVVPIIRCDSEGLPRNSGDFSPTFCDCPLIVERNGFFIAFENRTIGVIIKRGGQGCDDVRIGFINLLYGGMINITVQGEIPESLKLGLIGKGLRKLIDLKGLVQHPNARIRWIRQFGDELTIITGPLITSWPLEQCYDSFWSHDATLAREASLP